MRGTDQSLCNSRRAFRPLRHPRAIRPGPAGKAKRNGVPRVRPSNTTARTAGARLALKIGRPSRPRQITLDAMSAGPEDIRHHWRRKSEKNS